MDVSGYNKKGCCLELSSKQPFCLTLIKFRRLAKTFCFVPFAFAFPNLVHNQGVECLDRDQDEQTRAYVK